MAAFFRIAVISAILYLARFALAHQRLTGSSDSADSQLESWSNSEGSSENEFIKSVVPMDGSSEKSESSEKFIRSGVPLDSDGYSEKLLIKPIVPLNRDGSSEKVLIKSGVPLRGRTIHHTAWSKEDNVQESNEPQQQIDNGGEKFYDSWSLKKALNYILAFVYDVEDGGIISNLAPNSPENPNNKLKLQKSELDELMAVPQTHQTNPKDEAGNVSIYNRNRQNMLHTTPSYIVTYLEKQDVEWFEGGDGYLNNENRYSDYDYEDNEIDLLYEEFDSQYGDGFSDEPDEESAIDQGQRLQPKEMESKILKQHESDIQKDSRNEHLYKVTGNEPAFDAEHLRKSNRKSKEVNENAHKKKKEDDIQVNEGTHYDQNSNNSTQEPRKEIKVVKPPTHYSGKTGVNDQSINNKNPSIDTNQKLEEKAVDVITLRQDKTASQRKSIQPKKQDDQTMYSEKDSSRSKKQNLKPIEVSEDNVANKNSETFEVRRTIKGKPSTLNNSDQKDSKMKEEYMITQANVPDSGNQGYPQPKDEKRIIKTKPSTSVLQRHPQTKEQSQDSGNHVRKENSEILVAENNHGGKHTYILQQATTEPQYEKVLKDHLYDTRTTPENSIIYTGLKIHRPKVQGKKETVHLPEKKSPKVQSFQSNPHQNGKLPKNPLRENGTKHSKPNLKMLSDLYIDHLEPDENVGSYNYLLDSFEFIRVDENNRNKLKKKQDNSVQVFVKDEKHSAPHEKVPPILQSTPFKHQSEHELTDESHEVFGTILEYLYKISNNSFLLSLKENNSSES